MAAFFFFFFLAGHEQLQEEIVLLVALKTFSASVIASFAPENNMSFTRTVVKCPLYGSSFAI